MTQSNNIPTAQQQTAHLLLGLSWHFSGIKAGSKTIGHYNALATHIETEIECTCVGKSIQNFERSFSRGSLAGFKRNTTKETLAGFVLLKAGLIEDVEVQRDESGRGYNHPVHKYWVMFESQAEGLLPLLPQGEALEFDLSVSSESSAYRLEAILEHYEGSSWFVFSRSRKGGIYRHLLRIEKEKEGHLNKVFMKNGSSHSEDYCGTVGMDNGLGYLIFNLMTVDSQQKHLHLKMKVSRGVHPRFATGQSNFISSVSNQVMSDVNLFMRAPEGAELEKEAQCLFPGTAEYLNLPLPIRRYFYRPEQSRLVSPLPDIISLAQFGEWMEEQRRQQAPSLGDKVFHWVCGDYSVYYQNVEGEIYQCPLRIAMDPNVEEVIAEVATDYRQEFVRAQLFRIENRISLFASEHKGYETSSFYLNFYISLPFHEPDVCFFEGNICGDWQQLKGACSKAMLVKKDLEEPEVKFDERVAAFFGKDELRERA